MCDVKVINNAVFGFPLNNEDKKTVDTPAAVDAATASGSASQSQTIPPSQSHSHCHKSNPMYRVVIENLAKYKALVSRKVKN